MQIETSRPLAPFTTFKVGGNAAFFCQPENAADVSVALKFAAEKSVPWFVMGGGSNLLISDEGYHGLIIHTGRLTTITVEGQVIICQAGASVAALTQAASEHGLSGLEFAGGLPGSAGGAVYMNARCYGGSFSDVVESVETVTTEGIVQTMNNTELQYSYKYSRLMDIDNILVSAALNLKLDDPENVKTVTAENRQKRVDLGQYVYPSAGCIFKNDYTVNIPAGRIIDEAGLRTMRIGNAEVFERHGNFIVNTGSASAADIRALIEKVKATVFEKNGIRLEEEVRYLGFKDT